MRLKYIALLAARRHQELIARDQAVRLAFIKAEKPGSEAVRRAAFWEAGPQYTVTARRVALEKLVSVPDENSQQLLLAIFLADSAGKPAPSEDTLHAARASIEAGNKTFIDALLDYVRIHEDSPAQWGAGLLLRAGSDATIPIMLQWLRSKNPELRGAGARNLCLMPRQETVPALLDAISAEPPPKPDPASADSAPPAIAYGGSVEPRQHMIIALAQTGDPRGLDTLIEASKKPCAGFVQNEIARGLGRIRDKRGIPALAHLAETARDHGLQAEIVNAFYCILQDPRAFGPYAYGAGGPYKQDVHEGLERLKQWHD